MFFSKEKTPQILLLNIFIAGLYTFVLSLGNGFVNETLSKRFSWVEETRKRVIFGLNGGFGKRKRVIFRLNEGLLKRKRMIFAKMGDSGSENV